MSRMWNKKSKVNKLMALILAMLLAVTPLMTYVGDKEGAKAADTGTTEYYTGDDLNEVEYSDSQTNYPELKQDTSENGNVYYLQFDGADATECNTKVSKSYVADELKFRAGNINVTNSGHEYKYEESGTDKIGVVKIKGVEIVYTTKIKDQYVLTINENDKLSIDENRRVTVTSGTPVYVYIKPTELYSNDGPLTGESGTASMGYTLIGVYTFTKVNVLTVSWKGTRKDAANEEIGTSTANNKYSSAKLNCTLPANEVAGTWKYLSIKSDTKPSADTIKASTWSAELPSVSGSGSDGTYYGYVGYFGKDSSGEDTLISYNATSTPVTIDATAPTINIENVKYSPVGGSASNIEKSDINNNAFQMGSGDTVKMSFAVTDSSISKVDDITVNYDNGGSTFKRNVNNNTISYTTNNISASTINGKTLKVTATDNAGNSTTETFKIDGSDVTFNVVGATFQIGNANNNIEIKGNNSSAQVVTLVPTTDTGKTTYINNDWKNKNGTPSISADIKSDEKITKKNSSDILSINYEYKITGIDVNVGDGTYSRPYYTTSITKELSEGIYSNVGISYQLNNSVTNLSYGNIICDYTAPEMSAAQLQVSTDNGSTWNDVSSNCISNDNIYKINPNENAQYRYYVSASDTLSGLPDSATDAVRCSDNNYNFTITSDKNGYECKINAENLATIAPAEVKVNVYDKAGNSSEATLTRLVKETGDTKITPVLKGSDGQTIDLANITSYETNDVLELEVSVTSGVKIDNVSLTAKVNNADYTFKAASSKIAENIDPISKLYSAEYTFNIPANVNINNLIQNGAISVTTEKQEKYDKTQALVEIIYDITDPVFKTVVGETKNYFNGFKSEWYQDYTLNYEILSGEDSNIETELVSGSYTISNSKEDSSNKDLINSGNTSQSNSGTIEIPESATITGTQVVMSAADAAGNSSFAEIFIKVDKTAPTIDTISVTNFKSASIPLTGAPNISTTIGDNLTLSSAVMTVTYPDGTARTANLTADEGNNLSKTLSYQLESGAPDGEYKVTVTAADKAGNNAITKSMTFMLDNTKPVVTAKISGGTVGGKSLRADGTDMYYRSDVGVTFTCDDAHIKDIVVTDNDSQINVAWNNSAGTISVSGEGRHVIKINAVDMSGNKADEKQVEFIVDKTAPTISLALNGLPYSESKGVVDCLGNSTVTATVSDMTVDASDFYCQVVLTRPDQATQTPQYIKTDQRSFTFSEEGDYTINFYTLDMANNQSATRSVSFRIDKTAPEVSISGVSSGGTSANAANVSFSLKEAFWKDASGVITIYRKAGDASEETLYKTINVTPTSYNTITTESLTETGVYRMEFSATDRMGHKSQTSQTFTIDREAPVVTLAGVNNYDITDKTVEFKAEITDDFYSQKTVSIEGTRTDINGKKTSLSFASFNQHGNPTTINESYSEDGIYDITVTATDIAGSSHTSTVHFTVDKTAPVISGIDDLDGKVLKSVDLDFDLDEIVTDLTVCDVHMYLNGSEYDGVSDVEDGSYTLLITAEDELGQTSEKSVSFVLDTKAPVFIVTGVEDGETKEADYSIDVSLQLDEDTLKTVTLNGEVVTVNDNTAHIDVTDEGDYTLYMKAVDEAGNEAEQTIEFKYGKEVNVGMIILIIIIILLILAAVIFFIILAKRRKKDK